eukprot:3041136-Pyramimonas_sp.AAC.1
MTNRGQKQVSSNWKSHECFSSHSVSMYNLEGRPLVWTSPSGFGKVALCICIWGVECILAVIGTGGPVKRTRVLSVSAATAALAKELDRLRVAVHLLADVLHGASVGVVVDEGQR